MPTCMPSNLDLVPIYTSWVNRYLAKSGAADSSTGRLSEIQTNSGQSPKPKPITSLCSELRDHRRLQTLIQAVVPLPVLQQRSDKKSNNNCQLLAKQFQNNADGLRACIVVLNSVGINCSRFTVADIERGDLSSILQLVYALSTFKQELREKKKQREKVAANKQETMAPAAGTKIATPSMSLSTSGGGSGIPQARNVLSRIPAAGTNLHTSRIAQPSFSGLKPPTKCTTTTTGSTLLSRNASPLRKTAAAVNSPSSQAAVAVSSQASALPLRPSPSPTRTSALNTTSSPSLPTPQCSSLKLSTDPAKKRTIPRASSAIRPPKAATNTTISSSLQPAQAESKMIKLNLFSKQKKEATNKIAARPEACSAASMALSKAAVSAGASQPPAAVRSSPSRIALPSAKTQKESPAPPRRNLLPPTPTIIAYSPEEKRLSKNSDLDSAYGGFGSESPGSSVCSKEGNKKEEKEQPAAKGIPQPKRKIEEKPLLAVKGVTKIAKPGNSEKKDKSAIGVVSPIVKRHPSPNVPVKLDDISNTKNPESVKNLIGRNVNPACAENSPSPASPKIPTMSQLSSYQLLMSPGQQRRLPSTSNYCEMQSSTSESSLDSLSTTVRSMQERKGNSEMVRLRDRLNEYRDAIDGGRLGYHNYEDSSSLSSEISDQFEQEPPPSARSLISQQKRQPKQAAAAAPSGHFSLSDSVATAQREATNQGMTVATKLADYQHLLGKTAPRSPSASSDSHPHSRHQSIDREGIHHLLQQCKTSQRGAAMQSFGHPSSSSPSNGAGGFLSGDDSRMSHKRRSMRGEQNFSASGMPPVPPISTFHSLDRKWSNSCANSPLHHHSARDHYFRSTEESPLSALLSPRRRPPTSASSRHSQSPSVLSPSSLSSSMSRSLILLHPTSSAPPSIPSSSRSQHSARHSRSNRTHNHYVIESTPPSAYHPHHYQQGQNHGRSRLLSPSPSSPRHRLPLSLATAAANNQQPNNNGLVRTEVIYANCLDRDGMGRMQAEDAYGSCGSGSLRGSQLSLAGSATMPLNERYEAELTKMNRDLESYRVRVMTLTRKQEDYAHLFDVFDHKLSVMCKHVDKSQMKADDVKKLKDEIEHLRIIRNRLAVTAEKKFEGAGELLRHPSLESVTSVASHRSSMSTSSKSSKATDKSSLNSFGKQKKSWIRSSFTKAFSSKKKGKEIDEIDTNNRINEIEVDELKKKLEVRDTQLTDVRLDALDRAREVDVLRETVDKLKHENKQLRQDMHRLLSSSGGGTVAGGGGTASSCGRSRASSQASMRTQLDDDLYDTPPHTSSSAASISSKRSSGCSTVRVTVNVDLRGVINKSICPDHEICLGHMEMPAKETTWQEIDAFTLGLFKRYMERIDPDSSLGLEDASVIGYEIGDTVRDSSALSPTVSPFDVITPTTTVRMFLRGSCQQSVDSLVLESLFPKTMLEQLLRYLSTQRRLVLSGATGIGKSNLARQLAAYLCLKVGLQQDSVVDIKIPDDTNDKSIVKVEQQLESLLNCSTPSVILIDNIPRHRIAFVASVFSNANCKSGQGPYVICTVNRACQLPELNAHFKIFLLTNRMDGVKGFMARFLRRRIVEVEFRQCRQLSPDMLRVIQFLPIVLDAVNRFIEKANSLDVTVGPRIFLQCPLTLDEARHWFIRLWDTNILPYMIKVAREGSRVLGRVCSAADDPTEQVCEHWPWTEGPPAEECLHRLAIKEDSGLGSSLPNSKSTTTFNPLETLIRLQASKNAAAAVGSPISSSAPTTIDI